MATMNVSLPDQMKAWVEQQVAGGRFANTSDYVRDLIRRHQRSEERLVALNEELKKGLDSGVSTRTPIEIFEEAATRKRPGNGA